MMKNCRSTVPFESIAANLGRGEDMSRKPTGVKAKAPDTMRDATVPIPPGNSIQIQQALASNTQRLAQRRNAFGGMAGSGTYGQQPTPGGYQPPTQVASYPPMFKKAKWAHPPGPHWTNKKAGKVSKKKTTKKAIRHPAAIAAPAAKKRGGGRYRIKHSRL